MTSSDFRLQSTRESSLIPLYPQMEMEVASTKQGVKVLSNQGDVAADKKSRRIWQFLTLGIPRLIETFALFLDGVIHREKMGVALRFRFHHKDMFFSRDEVVYFHEFNQPAQILLTKAEVRKVWQLIGDTINIKEKASAAEDTTPVRDCDALIQKLANLLQKNQTPKATRKDFNQEDWETLDIVDYELAREHFAHLVDIFNSTWYKSLCFQQEMQNHFGVDHNEAIVAESLALSLAYMEKVNGKKIDLPVKEAGKESYRKVEYTIKETRLGDNLPCYLLESDDRDAHPWMLIRGTQYYTGVTPEGKEYRTGSLESILADAIDPKGIARGVITKSIVHRPVVEENGHYVQKESLTDVFDRWRREGKKAILTGHSLGGYLVNNFAVRFYPCLEKAYAFSSAGVSRELYKKWNKILQREAALNNSSISILQRKIVNFDYEGDLVPALGDRLIGLHLAVGRLPTPEKKEGGLYQTHVRGHLNHDFVIQQVDVHAENGKFVRLFFEMIRTIAGRCFRFFLNLFSQKHIPDWWKNRKVYREQVKFQKMIAKVKILSNAKS
jgi:hypothetical protein